MSEEMEQGQKGRKNDFFEFRPTKIQELLQEHEKATNLADNSQFFMLLQEFLGFGGSLFHFFRHRVLMRRSSGQNINTQRSLELWVSLWCGLFECHLTLDKKKDICFILFFFCIILFRFSFVRNTNFGYAINEIKF